MSSSRETTLNKYRKTSESVRDEELNKYRKSDTINALGYTGSPTPTYEPFVPDSVKEMGRKAREDAIRRIQNGTNESVLKQKAAEGREITTNESIDHATQAVGSIYKKDDDGNIIGKSDDYGNLNEKTRGYLRDYYVADKAQSATSGYAQYGTNFNKQKADAKNSFMKATGMDEKQFQKYLENYAYLADYEGYEQSKKEYYDATHTGDWKKNVANTALYKAVDVAGTPVAGLASFGSLFNKSSDPLLGRNNHTNVAALRDVSNISEEGELENIEELLGEGTTATKLAQFADKAGTAAAKSMYSMLLGGAAAEGLGYSTRGLTGEALEQTTKMAKRIANIVTLPSFGMSAFDSEYRNAQERGLSSGRAFATALVAGSLEAFTEVFSLDRLYDVLKNGGQATLKSVIKDGLISAGIEGTEEFANDLYNSIFDRLINGDEAEINTTINYYQSDEYAQANGLSAPLSYEEAAKKATSEWWSGALESFLLGTASGLIGSVGASTFGKGLDMGNDLKNIHTMQRNTGYATAVQQGISPERADYANEKAYLNAAKAKSQGALDLARTTENNGLTYGQSRDLYKGAKNAAQNTVEPNIPAEYKTARTTEDRAINSINNATTPRELVEAYQSAPETRKAEKAYEKKIQEFASKGISRSQVDNFINAERAFTMKSEGKEFNEEQQKYIDNDETLQKASKQGENQYITKSNNDTAITTDGDAVVIDKGKGIEQTEDGKVLYTTDGKPISLEDIDAPSPTVARMMLYDSYEFKDQGIKDAADAFLDNSENATSAKSVLPMLVTDARLGAISWDTFYEQNKISLRNTNTKTAKRLFEEIRTKEDMSDSTKANPKTVKGSGVVSIDGAQEAYDELSDTHKKFIEKFAERLGVDIVIHNKKSGVRGSYDPENGKIVLNIYKKKDIFEVALHEGIGEFMQAHNQDGYNSVADAVIEFLYRTGSKELREEAYKYRNLYRTVGRETDKTLREASNEFVNDNLGQIFSNEDSLEKFANWLFANNKTSALQAIKDFFQSLKDLILEIKEMGGLKPSEIAKHLEFCNKVTDEILKQMDVAIANRDTAAENDQFGDTENTERNSIVSLYEGLNLTFSIEEGRVMIKDDNGEEITEITDEMVLNSPFGAVIMSSGLSGDAKEKQIQNNVDLMNMLIKVNDPDLIWATSSIIGFNPLPRTENAEYKEPVKMGHAALTSNSDPQYQTTVDFTTICLKTQAIIDVMSEIMKRNEKGLTEKEITEIVYKETHDAGEPVPCPVCYVFSRWVGLGGLFDNMKKLQDKYENVSTADIKKDADALEKEINKRVLNGLTKGKAKTEIYKELVSEQKELQEKKALDKITKKESEKLDELNEKIQMLDNWTWITTVRLHKDYNTKGKVPSDILFDINAGNTFASKYPLAWKYRTTRGPAMGKAATPYAAQRTGQTILGIAAPSKIKNIGNTETNVFLNAKDGVLDKTAKNKISSAKANAKKQNLMNGQRLQSTSDFRFEYVLDYMTMFYELQAIGSKVQLYTKVPESVPMFTSVGCEVNLSLMPKGIGYVECKKSDPNAILLNKDDGKYYKLDFSNVTGMDAEDAFALSNLYDNAQPILVGTSESHIRLAMRDNRITFIIPYHSSGANEERYKTLMEAVEESVESREDFSSIQNDKRLPDEKRTSKQDLAYDLRKKILTGKAKTLTKAEKELLSEGTVGSEILRQLYIRFYGVNEKGKTEAIAEKYLTSKDRDGNRLKDNTTYNVALKASQANMVMPFEYWDMTTTIDNAKENGKTFVSYLEFLGMVPRFEKFADEDGYWKTLIDRPMYNNDGTYHEQNAINMTDFKQGYLTSKGANEELAKSGVTINTPTKSNDRSKVNDIVERSMDKMSRSVLDDGKHRSSLDLDSLGNELTKYQVDFFKNSKVRDENGRLKVVYHGSETGRQTVFNANESDDGISFFFTSSRPVALGYSGIDKEITGRNHTAIAIKTLKQAQEFFSDIKIEKRGNKYVANGIAEFRTLSDLCDWAWWRSEGNGRFINGGVLPVYLNIENPLVIDANGSSWAKINTGIDGLDVANTREISKYAKENGYDGVIISNVYDNGKYGGYDQSDVYVVYNSEQIKFTDNNHPTSNPDLRKSIDVDSIGNKLSKDQVEFFKDSKVRDENGRLIVLYHGTDNGGFNVFDSDYIDYGTFFTTSKKVADSFSESSIEYAPKMPNTIDELVNYINDVYEEDVIVEKYGDEYVLGYGYYADGSLKEDARGKTVEELYESYVEENGDAIFSGIYKCYANLTNPLIINANSTWDSIQFRGEEHTVAEVAKIAKEEGYDGLIVNNVLEGGTYYRNDEMATDIVVFEPSSIKSVKNESPTSSPDIRKSVNVSDESYMEAVESGDMETAQRMVEQEAINNGYTIRGYHGTNAEFNVFDPDKLGSKNFMASSAKMGFFASKSKETAESYTGLNYADMISLSLNKDAQEGMARLKEKYNYESRYNDFIRERDKFELEYKKSHGFDELEKSLSEFEALLNDVYDDESLKKAMYDTFKKDKEYYWNKDNANDMLSAWEETEYASSFREYESMISDEWEQLEIKRRGYVPNVKNLFIKMVNPFVYDFKGDGRDTESFAARMAKAIENGNDGCIFLNVADGADIDDIYTVFSNTQLKSADTVTYDDNGNIIPLSERFNDKKDDIRYSLDIESLTEKQKSELDDRAVFAFNINIDTQDFTEQILNGTKTIETRKQLVKVDDEPLKAGDRVGIIATGKGGGMLLGYATIKAVHKYDSVKSFRKDYKKHRVSAGSEYDITNVDKGIKYGYEFEDVVRLEEPIQTTQDYGHQNPSRSGRSIRYSLETYDGVSPYSNAFNNASEVREIISKIGAKKVKPGLLKDLSTKLVKGHQSTIEPLKLAEDMYTLGNAIADGKDSGIIFDYAMQIADELVATSKVTDPKNYNYGIDGANKEDASVLIATEILSDYFKLANDAEAAIELKRNVEVYKQDVENIYRAQVAIQKSKLKEEQERLKVRQKSGFAINKKLLYTNDELDAAARKAANEAINSYVGRVSKAKYMENIKRTGARLMKYIYSPTDKQHVPDFMREPLAEFLNAIDFLPERKGTKTYEEWSIRMSALQNALDEIVNVDSNGREDGAYAMSWTMEAPYLQELMKDFIANAKKYNASKVSLMPYEDLKTLSIILDAISSSVNKMNENFANESIKEVEKLGEQSVMEMMSQRGRQYNTLAGKIAYDFFNLEESEPITYFERLGSSSYTVYQELRKGFDKKITRVNETSDFMADLKERLGIKDDEIKEWAKKTYTFNGGALTLTVPQIMSFYETMKRDQGREHVMVGGIKAGDTSFADKLVKKYTHQVKPVHVSENFYKEIVSKLTDKQKNMADAMQKYMAVNCSEWGNNVSRAMYGYSKFTEEDYFPIATDKNSNAATSKTESSDVSLRAIQNASFTKALTPNANNAVVMNDIFDVFTNHVVNMANYEGYAMPIADAMRWYNYSKDYFEKEGDQKRRDQASVKEAIDHMFGEKGKKYFIQFIKDINGDVAGAGGNSTLSAALMGMYKAQAVGANIRVVVQQPTAVIRALDRIEGKYILEAIPQGKSYAKKAQEKSVIANYKAKGYFETMIGKSMKAQITGEETLREKVTDIASKPAGLADDISWGVLYRAAELKVIDTRKDLKYGTAEFDKEVVRVFEDIIDHTQVVDTIFHKSQIMKSQNGFAKMQTAFMAEPTKTWNMIMRALTTGSPDRRKKKILKTLMIFAFEQVVNAAIVSLIDALRDDEKTSYKESYDEYIVDNLTSNLNLINLFPVLKEITNAIEGYDASRMDTEVIYTTIETLSKLYKHANGDGNLTTYGVIYQASKAISQATSMPISNAMRDVKSVYNTIADPEHRLYSSDTTATSAIKKDRVSRIDTAFESGDIKKTMKEIKDEFIAQGKTEQEAKEAAGQLITSTYKEELIALYKTDKDKALALKKNMLSAYQAVGYDYDKKNKTMNEWFK